MISSKKGVQFDKAGEASESDESKVLIIRVADGLE